MDAAIISRVAHEVSLSEPSVAATVGLFEKGGTCPFIVHYRKEASGGLDETQVRAIHERYTYYREVLDRRAAVLMLVTDQGKLTEELRARIESSFTKVELEDLYHQFRPKKRTRAAEAVEKGLEPLAEYLWNQEPDAWSLQEHIDVFVDPAKKVATREQALQGASEIIAQGIAENIDFRKALRELLWNEGSVVSTVVPAKAEQKTKYIMYYNRRESVTTIPSHRVLAIRRGSKEGILTSSIEGNHERAVEQLLSQVIRDRESPFAPILEAATRESYSRILRPLIETEVRAQLKERADREAIRVFQENLANLLLSPPAGQMVVAGLDMVKSGECTLAVVDERGKFLEDCVIRFAPPKTPPARSPQVAKAAMKTAPVEAKAAEPAAATPDDTVLPPQDTFVAAATVSEPPETAPLEAPVGVAEVPEQTGPGIQPAEQAPEEKAEGAAAAPTTLEAGTVAVDTAAQGKEPAPIVQTEPPALPPEPSESAAAAVLETVPEPQSVSAVEPLPEPVTAAAMELEPAMSVGEAAPAPALVPETPVENTSSASTELEPATEATAARQADVAAQAPVAQPPVVDYLAKAKSSILELIARHSVQVIAIGAGTGARELEATLRQILADGKIENVLVAAVSDAGIAVYSSSRVAREELPDLTVSARCAVTLARRLQDPLAEMVKIDPKLIGVGQYQHDVDQKELHRGLLQTVQACVNKVGVDVNTAGYSLLRYVSGLSDRLAHRIVASRSANGSFPSRQALLHVPGFDSATFEQAAGFLRVRGGENPLDATAVHPETYPIVEKMAAAQGVGIADLIGNKDRISSLRLEEFVDGRFGMPTLIDIREELFRPGRDPRRTFALPKFRPDVKDLNDLKKGMVLEGTVTNVTNFGAFVDVGVHQDGLVHLSQMSNRFIRDPREAVKVGDVVQVKVISVEPETKRIGLSMKALLPSNRRRSKVHRPGGRPPQAEGAAQSGDLVPSTTPGDAGAGAAPARPGRGERRERDRGRSRRRDNRRHERPARTAAVETKTGTSEPKPQTPEPSLQEKIAILQSKFRGIS